MGDMRQSSRRLRLSFAAPASFDADGAAKYLSETFKIDMGADPGPARLGEAALDEASSSKLIVICALARHLLQAGGIPVFERPTVRKAEGPSGQGGPVIVDLLVPVVENMLARCFSGAYEAALSIASEFAVPSDRRKDLQRMADELEEGFVKPTLRASAAGIPTIPFLREVFGRGIPFFHVARSAYQLGTGARARLFLNGATDRDSAIGALATVDKSYTQLVLQGIGAPIPKSIRVRDADHALRAAERIGFPLVVKPADRDRGEGVTVDIATADEVRAAFEAAAHWSKNILLQERIPGLCHRLVTFRGKFVFAFTRHPKSVVGDGRSTVEELVRRASETEARRARHLRAKPFPLDDVARQSLAAQGYAPSSVLDEGALGYLRAAQTRDEGGHHETITDVVHPDNVALAERISRAFRLESMGLDLISTDPRKPWHQTRAAITELNWQPQIGENSARAYLDEMFSDGANIPVECFVGSEGAMAAGRERQAELLARGLAAALTSHEVTVGPDGKPVVWAGAPGLRRRAAALLRDGGVEALVVVAETDEVLHAGRPLHSFSKVTIVGETLRSQRQPSVLSAIRGRDRLRDSFAEG